MKPHHLTIVSGVSQSFTSRRDQFPDVNNHWHYHDELELIYVKKGSGTQFIGDNIKNFRAGTVALIGSNLPHYWQFDDVYFQDATKKVEVYVIHFKKDFLGKTFLDLPENTGLKAILDFAELGLEIEGKPVSEISLLLENMIHSSGGERLMLLIKTLFHISKQPYVKLASLGFKATFRENEKNRINIIYNFSIKQYKRKIELQEVADLVQLTKSSFCKYFKTKTGRTYTYFLNEIRVGQACKLLIDNNFTIKEIGFMCGFNNSASFHKCFYNLKGMTPLRFKKAYDA